MADKRPVPCPMPDCECFEAARRIERLERHLDLLLAALGSEPGLHIDYTRLIGNSDLEAMRKALNG